MGKEQELIIDAQGHTKRVTPQGYSSSEFTDRKIVPSSEEQTYQMMIDMLRLRQEQDPSQNEATVNIETNLPWIALLGSGDWHMGSDKVDIELWHKHQSYVMETPGLYEVVVGDERDNFVLPKFREGLFEGILSPTQQALFVEAWLKKLDGAGKIIARCGGNHDGWGWSMSGVSIEDYWYRQMRSPLLRNGGFIHLNVNGTPYEGYIHHGQSLYNSTFNPNHATKRAFEFQGPFDFGILGHKHVAEIAHGYRWNDSHTKDYVQIRSGTYKTDDQFARSRQMGRGQPGGTCVLLCTAEKRAFPLLKIEDAVEVLTALNK